jgi:hypothetical protein
MHGSSTSEDRRPAPDGSVAAPTTKDVSKMSEIEQVDEVDQGDQVDQVEEPTVPAAPRKGDEDAYEDSWYQVLRRLAPGLSPRSDEA